MPAPKFTVRGHTLKRVALSVFVHPDLYKRVRSAADGSGQSLSDWFAGLAAKTLKWKQPKEKS
jgi:hypothetical protein